MTGPIGRRPSVPTSSSRATCCRSSTEPTRRATNRWNGCAPIAKSSARKTAPPPRRRSIRISRRKPQRTAPRNRIKNEEEREKSRARLFGRARYLGHPALAAGDLSLRSRDLHRRYWAGRRACAGAQEGRADGGEGDLHRRSARGV